MQARADEINANLQLQSLANDGTRVKISLYIV
jgi:signal transduction histidine kinase